MNCVNWNLNRKNAQQKARVTLPKQNASKNGTMGPPLGPTPRHIKDTNSTSSIHWGRSFMSPATSTRSGNTTVTTESEYRVVLALTESRGSTVCEVGMAVIDLSLPKLILCQISDTTSYINTLTKINIYNPTEIVVPNTFLESATANTNRMVNIIRSQFPQVIIKTALRKTFNKVQGMERIQELCIPTCSSIIVGVVHRYFALAATSALFSHLNNNLFVFYAQASISIEYEESEGFAIIDVSTADRLELVSCMKPTQATRFSTLFGVLNNCVTKMGMRYLRAAILQPFFYVDLINERQQCITELLQKSEVLLQIPLILQRVTHLDQLLTISSILGAPNIHRDLSVTLYRPLNYILLVNNLIELIEPLQDTLSVCKQPFFVQLCIILQDNGFVNIRRIIRDTIQSEAHCASGQQGVLQRCFAVRPGISRFLDVIRKTYTERMDEMREYVAKLGVQYTLPLVLSHNNTKGYHIVLPLNSQRKRYMKKTDLPPLFNHIFRLAGSFTMKTVQLITLSNRIDYIVADIMRISNSIIYNLLMELRQYIPLFYRLCESIAKLDLIQSLTKSSGRNLYVRPKFNTFTELTNAYHPLLDFLCDKRPVPNPISVSPEYNVQIITGPNGSGKSIYIRQVMLLQIMAQIGCYVPASSAVFRPSDRLFARVYLEDNMEFGASTFMLEIREVIFMLNTLTSNSLFIIDELCRSTGVEEATTLAMALCERFSLSTAFVYITTHFAMLTKMADMYLNFKLWQMDVVATGKNARDAVFHFKYDLIPGASKYKYCALYLIRNVWPDYVVEKACDYLELLENTTDIFNKFDTVVHLNSAVQLQYKLYAVLKQLYNSGKLTESTMNKHLNSYRHELEKLEFPIWQQSEDLLYYLLEEAPSKKFLSNAIVQNHTEANQENVIHSSYMALAECIGETMVTTNLDPSSSNSTYRNLKNYLENFKQQRTDAEMVQECTQLLEEDDEEFTVTPKLTEAQEKSVEYEHFYPNVKIKEYLNESSPTTICSHDKDGSSIISSFKESDENRPQSKRFKPPSYESNANAFLDDNYSRHKPYQKRIITRRFKQTFQPPFKLSKREIQAEFAEQDRLLYKQAESSDDCTKYVERLLNRPTVEQIQKTEHLAVVRRKYSSVQCDNTDSTNEYQIFTTTTTSNPCDLFTQQRRSNNIVNSQRLLCADNQELFIFSDKYATDKIRIESTVLTATHLDAIKDNLNEFSTLIQGNSSGVNMSDHSMMESVVPLSQDENIFTNLTPQCNMIDNASYHFEKEEPYQFNMLEDRNSVQNVEPQDENAAQSLNITPSIHDLFSQNSSTDLLKNSSPFKGFFENNEERPPRFFLGNDDFLLPVLDNSSNDESRRMTMPISEFTLTQDGFYKDNRNNIRDIFNRYLPTGNGEQNGSAVGIFEDQQYSFNEETLNL